MSRGDALTKLSKKRGKFKPEVPLIIIGSVRSLAINGRAWTPDENTEISGSCPCCLLRVHLISTTPSSLLHFLHACQPIYIVFSYLSITIGHH